VYFYTIFTIYIFSEDDELETERNVTVLLNAEESTLHIVNRPMDQKVSHVFTYQFSLF